MAFIYCVFCNSVSGVRASQLHYGRPVVRSSYMPLASDVFEHYRNSTSRLRCNDAAACSFGFKYSVAQHSTLDDRSHRWTSPVIGWHRTRQPDDAWLHVARVADRCHNSYDTCNCSDAYISDHCCQSSVKRRAELYKELPAFHHCQCCTVIPGLCKSVCVCMTFGWHVLTFYHN